MMYPFALGASKRPCDDVLRQLQQNDIVASTGDALSLFPTELLLAPEDLQLDSQPHEAGEVVPGRVLGVEVAVKLLPLHPASRRPDNLADLQREVARMAGLWGFCRHVAPLLGLSVKDGCVALVMRSYPTNLARHLSQQKDGRLDPGSAMFLARDVLQCLVELHGLGVVVSDINPDKVLLDRTGAAVLGDIGLSRAIRAITGDGPASTKADVSALARCAYYRAPEQFGRAGGRAAQCDKCDLWGFGCTLLHALTGKKPWAGIKLEMLFVQMASSSPESPPLKPGMPAALHSLLAACLRPEPQDRPTALSALSTLTRALVAGFQALASPPANQPTNGVTDAAAANVTATNGTATKGTVVNGAVCTGDDTPPSAVSGTITTTAQQQQPPPVGMVAQILKADPATLSVTAEPVAVVPLVDVKIDVGQGAAGTVDVSGRLQLEALLAGLASLNIPEPNLRLLLRNKDTAAVTADVADGSGLGSEVMEVSLAQLSGEGLLLKDSLDAVQAQSFRQLYVLDTRVPGMRVDLVLHGTWGTATVKDVEVDAAMSSDALVAKAVAAAAVKLPANCQHPTAGFMLRPNGAQRRPLPVLLGFGQRSELGLTPGGECHFWARPEPGQSGAGDRLDLNVEVSGSKSLFITTCGEALLLDVKRMVEERERIPVRDQRLAIASRALDSDLERLAACGLKSGDTLLIMCAQK